MLVIILLTSLVTTYLIVNFAAIFRRNQKAFRFYQEKCPNLPTVPGPGMFTGHLLSIIMNDNGWKTIDELHNKLGPSFGMFHVNQPWVATKDVDLIKLIEVDEARKHTNRAFLGGPLEHFNNSIFQIFNEDWRRTRQIVAPTLTNLVVKGKDVSSDVEFVVDKLSSSLKRKLNKSREAGGDSFELHIRDTCERFALAVIFLVTYQQNDMIDFDAEQDKWTQLFAQGARDGANPLTLVSMMFPFLRKAITLIARLSPFGRWEANIVGYIQDAVNRKTMQMERGEESKTNSANEKIAQHKRTLLDTLIEAYTAKKIKYEHFMGSLLLLVMAGAVTTADTISCLIWQLAWNPDIQERLRESVAEEGIGSEYLSWCINETIRWHPAVPMGTGRILGEDVEVNGQYLPRGTFVMPSTYSIHHDAKIWPEPDKFDPDRWRNQANFHPAAFVGFGLGPRNCLGRFLAVHEMKLALKMILSQYKIEPCAKTPKEWRFKVPAMLYTLMDEPLMIRLRPLSTD